MSPPRLLASREPLEVGRKYWLRHGNRWLQARIVSIERLLDIDTQEATGAHGLALNDIGHVTVESSSRCRRALCDEPRRRRVDRGR